MKVYQLAGHIAGIAPIHPETLDEMSEYEYNGMQMPETVFTVTPEALAREEARWLAENRAEIESSLLSKQFYTWLLGHDGSYLHACAVVMDGYAYAFTADSGTGKSTQMHLWKQRFGAERVTVLNDDKPFLRFDADGRLLACGSPWCGKEVLHCNAEAPLAAICLLRQASENHIRRFTPQEAVMPLLRQIYLPEDEALMDKALAFVERVVATEPIYELGCTLSDEAAELAYQAMRPDKARKETHE